MDAAGMIREMEWQTKDQLVKDQIMIYTMHVGYCYDEGRKSIRPSSALYGTVWGDPFSRVEYQKKFIGFVRDIILGVNPNAIVIKDELWTWSTVKVVNAIVKLTAYFDNPANKGLVYKPKQGDLTEDTETPVLLFIPAGLVE